MTVPPVKTEDVKYIVEKTTVRSGLKKAATEGIEARLGELTGLSLANVEVASELYTVEMQATDGKSRVKGSGKTIDDAINDATKNGSIPTKKRADVKLKVEQTVKAPYHTVDVKVRAVDEPGISKERKTRVSSLKSSYGPRLKGGVESVTYHAIHTAKRYGQGGTLPGISKPIPEQYGTGQSTNSFADALNNAGKRPRGAKSTVLELHEVHIIYGLPQGAQAPRSRAQSGSPGPSRPKKGGGRRGARTATAGAATASAGSGYRRGRGGGTSSLTQVGPYASNTFM